MATNVCKISKLLGTTRKTWLPLLSQVRYRKYDPKNEKDNLQWVLPLVQEHLQKQSEAPAEREPSKLHVVWRVHKLYGRPYWEKKTMKDLGLDGKKNKLVVHKNTPSVNEKLKTVQHLVNILPVTFPTGLPESEEDFAYCLLNDSGQFVVQKSIQPLSEIPTTEEADPVQLTWKIDRETVKKRLKRRLEVYSFHSEYFKPNYRYKYNQDGKEFRYFGDNNVGAEKEWF